VLTLPATSGTLALTGGGGGGITAMTAQDVTGVFSVDFTGIPATAKRISVMLYSCQTGGHDLNIQVGTAGGVLTSSGYTGTSMICNNSGGISNNYITTGLLVLQNQVTSSNAWSGIFTLNNIDGYKWSFAGSASTASAYIVTSAGIVDAGADLTTIRVTIFSGNFTSGTVNVFYE
jgi:hypothetical protein